MIEGVTPDGVHAKVYPGAATAVNVTVAGKSQTPLGPLIVALGCGLIVILDVVDALHPAALTTFNKTA